jgi:hypothetical protein
MSEYTTARYPVEACANSGCLNKPHGGQFVIVVSTLPVSGSGMPVLLIMCSPCADALRGVKSPR